MVACRYRVADADGDLLPGWSAGVVAGAASAVRLDARYAATDGGWLRVWVGGLRAVSASRAGSQGASGRVAFEATEQNVTMGFEAAWVTSVAETVAAGRGLLVCLESGRVVLVEPCGGRTRGARRRR